MVVNVDHGEKYSKVVLALQISNAVVDVFRMQAMIL